MSNPIRTIGKPQGTDGVILYGFPAPGLFGLVGENVVGMVEFKVINGRMEQTTDYTIHGVHYEAAYDPTKFMPGTNALEFRIIP